MIHQINTDILPITLIVSLPIAIIMFIIAMGHVNAATKFLYGLLGVGALALTFYLFGKNDLIGLQLLFTAMIFAESFSAFKKPSVRVTISQTAANQARDEGVPQRILMKLASYIEWQITKSGYPQPSYYMKNSNIVVTIGEENPKTHEISMLTCKRDSRYNKGGQLLLAKEEEAPAAPKGKPLDERRQKAKAREDKKLRQRQQSLEQQKRKAGNARPESEIPKNGRK